ncbi:unnamed protein product [Brassica rapa]|uniref:Uncharacterized protein n=2 Tax=Brassica TaxID=3705 RepID=A0A8D9GSR6_BRACM|nr:unnamed protein product [Brassica napus]CAG7885774.1 unnamed protein product [Brassica rapa]
MKLLFGEFGTFGDVLKSRMVILVHKTNAAAKRQDKGRWSVQRPSAAAK